VAVDTDEHCTGIREVPFQRSAIGSVAIAPKTLIVLTGENDFFVSNPRNGRIEFIVRAHIAQEPLAQEIPRIREVYVAVRERRQHGSAAEIDGLDTRARLRGVQRGDASAVQYQAFMT
jgi:hypothetical protein